MAGIDGLLRMMATNQADELRLGTDAAPRMLARGAAVRLSIPPTDGDTLRLLVGELLTPERASTLRAERKVELEYAPAGGGVFAVKLELRAGASAEDPAAPFDVVFRSAPARPTVTPARTTPLRPTPAPVAAAPAPVATEPVRAIAPVEKSPRAFPDGDSDALHQLLAHAVALKASDLHLAEGEPPVFRVDGRLRLAGGFDEHATRAALAPFAESVNTPSGRSIDEAITVDGLGRFRINVYRAGGRLAAAVRALPPSAPSLQELNLPVPLADLADAPHGLVLVCGPTGAGKSATLAALAQEALRRSGGLLITLEDPVEYAIAAPPSAHGSALVRQRQLGSDVPDFATGLRDALREDPDLLLVGEMRDAESISLALTAAETGHLVFASLHSRSSASTVQRILDAYPGERQHQVRGQLADSLRAVVCQRLLPRARGEGRVPALEVMRGTLNVAALIRDGKTEQVLTAIQSGRKEGMIPLERCLADLVRAGTVERSAAIAAANDPAALLTFLQG